MRRLLALAALGLTVAGACGAGSGAEPSVLGHTFERASVSGVVRREGAPLAGARVLLGEDGRSTVTDAAGSFRFDQVEPGSYRLVALDTGDSSVVCSGDDACITARAARHATVEVHVATEPVVVDVVL